MVYRPALEESCFDLATYSPGAHIPQKYKSQEATIDGQHLAHGEREEAMPVSMSCFGKTSTDTPPIAATLPCHGIIMARKPQQNDRPTQKYESQASIAELVCRLPNPIRIYITIFKG